MGQGLGICLQIWTDLCSLLLSLPHSAITHFFVITSLEMQQILVIIFVFPEIPDKVLTGSSPGAYLPFVWG